MVIVEGIDLIHEINKFDVILVGTNTYCTMNNGFQGKIRRRYNFVYQANCKTKYADINKLGTRVNVSGEGTIFSLCFISHGYNFTPNKKPVFVDYKSLENCLRTANVEFAGLKVATVLMGGTEFDGGGDKKLILKMMEENSDRIDLYVYDYVQHSSKTERSKVFIENSAKCVGNPQLSKEIAFTQMTERSKLTSFDEPAYTGRLKLKKRLRDLANN